ncbi:MAG: hypothetical protein ACOCWD_03515 [Tangfeifania sp.]
MKKEDYLYDCITAVINKLEWGSVENWGDRDYILLSDLLYQNSGLKISKNTLKNLFKNAGKDKDYYPQQATRDALCVFLGYENWNDFIRNHIKDSRVGKGKKKENRFIPVIVSIVLLFTGFALLKWFPGKDKTYKNDYDIVFEASPRTGKAPHTVSFYYDISDVPYEEIYLDHHYEHHKAGYQRKLLGKNRDTINHCFQIPGNYHVTLRTKDAVLSSIPIHVSSNGWICMVSDRYSETMEQNKALRFPEFKHLVFNLYHVFKDTIKDEKLYIPPYQLKALDVNPKFYFTEFRNIRDFNCPGDDCTLEIKFKNAPEEGGISCFDSQFILQGDSSYTKITLVEPGCYRYANAVIGKEVISGEGQDLSSLQFDLSQWRIMRIETKNNRVSFFMDDELFFQRPYNVPLQNIIGLIFTFKGSGAIDYVKLFNGDMDLVYMDDFAE